MSQYKYQLKTGKAGETQLDNLDKMFGKGSRQFLQDIGLKTGMQIADVGCGIGNLSCWFAEKIGSQGHVYAIDNNAGQLKIARQRAKERGINNISFHKMDVHDLSKFNEKLDLTYCRWLLIHVQNPVLAVNSMAKTVRPNGVLACEVGDMRTNYYYPPFEAHAKFFKKSAKLLKQSGSDMDICFKIFGIFKSLDGFSDVNIRLSQPLISNLNEIESFKSQLCVLIESMTESFIEKKIMPREEIIKLKSTIQTQPVSENTLIFLSRMTQIWCHRR